MKFKVLILLIISVMGTIMCNEHLYAYSLQVHTEITKRVIDQNKTKLNNYLTDIGLINGIDEKLKSGNDKKRAREWIEYGSWKEDFNWDWNNNPLFSHFYNPITNTSGVGDIWPSAYEWANASNNDWSWIKARNYFYQGLTLTTKTQREEALAKAFRGIGHIIHLVEDVAVPAHTRGDIHVSDPYESYTNTKISSLQYTSVPFLYWNISSSPAAPKQFWDLDSYNGSTPYSGDYLGLSEYTNANFFSEDTIYDDFSYPDWPSVVEYNDVNINGKITTYLRKLGYANGGYGESINHLAAGKWFYKYIPSSLISLKKSALMLDDRCHEDYQQKLIPRAVGYSAGLLDYFFRGTLEITMPDSYVYSITDGSVIPQQFTRLKAKVRNSTPDSIPGEEIQGCNIQQQNCIIQAVARYKKRTDYQPDLSTDPPTASSREADYSYSVSAPIAISSLSSTTPTEFTFDFISNPIPAGITDLYLHVVFKGTLGNETDIAIAVGMKDLNEPQHFSIWNATDRFYLDGILRTASEIRNDPSLLARVDFNGNGIPNETGEPYIDPYDVTTEIAFYPTGVIPTIYNATFTPLPSGRYGRIIILTDMPTFYMLIHRNSTNPPDDMTANFLFSGVTNQDNNGTFQNTQVITFRGIIQHTWSAYARSYPYSTGISTAPWPVPSNINPYPTSTMYP
ncbi:MAG: hypothetical protein Q8N09_12150 [Thermodesulfovibrionia bacterium]|nr:hypothetical protein [Thermodesulfovibrionia bacterium]